MATVSGVCLRGVQRAGRIQGPCQIVDLDEQGVLGTFAGVDLQISHPRPQDPQQVGLRRVASG